MNDDPGFLTIGEVARLAWVTPEFVRGEVRRGRLAAVRFGVVYRVLGDAAKEFLARGSAARQLHHDVRTNFVMLSGYGDGHLSTEGSAPRTFGIRFGD